MARVFEADSERGAMLLERLKPGETLIHLCSEHDARATSIAASVMRRFWKPLPSNHTFLPVPEWAKGLSRLRLRFNGGTGPFPSATVSEAERLFQELLSSMEETVLLHGDLHHENILSAEREPWLAIDPKGVAGEAAYEAGALIRNPLPWLLEQPDSARITCRRLDQLADELGLNRERLRKWSFAQAVLSGWWSYEDHGRGWEPALAVADLLK